jgi:hypothetical protein
VADKGNSDGVLRIVGVNLLDGGVDDGPTFARRDLSVAALAGWRPHVVLVQELIAPGLEHRRYLRSLAGELGMEPAALGLPRGSKRQRCAILADTTAVAVLDDGPPDTRDAPYWAEAVLRVRATGTVLAVTSVHAPATTGAGQLAEAERLATRTVQRGVLAVAGGDWNSYTPSDGLTDDDLRDLPPHLRPSRMRALPGGGITGNYDVHDTLACAGPCPP